MKVWDDFLNVKNPRALLTAFTTFIPTSERKRFHGVLVKKVSRIFEPLLVPGSLNGMSPMIVTVSHSPVYRLVFVVLASYLQSTIE